MNQGSRKRRIPDIVLEQYLLGELSAEEMTEAKRILDEDPESRARLSALEQSNRDILEQYPADLMGQRIHRRLGESKATSLQKPGFPRPLKLSVGLAAAVMVLFFFLPVNFTSWRSGEGESTNRVKGQGAYLKLYRKTPSGSEALENGALVSQGSLVRIAYQAAGRAYGAIVSVDGRGKVSLHLPQPGNTHSVRLETSGEVLLDFALELDDAPRFERFYFVTGDAPFDVIPVLEAAGQIDIEGPIGESDRLDLPRGLDQFVFSVRKGVPK